ncbi:gluconate 2-dehydrogenase subunit 3 family protein [Rubrobacter marinus]|uniref:Gluconate 2-dehydrogenase subunit 3 family protein n=1 Tax=Rubrobacter marinus TaxID=2653852 RepID=A0A6G8PWA2_9ACTN|nr:gluconate 2-dehydrogenase subunit 3 family protein [Rubrobacter marinus]QIN78488.1 gluconate 2-dehydrogenase subunit 3 family protein [Rubrobacter marinus]
MNEQRSTERLFFDEHQWATVEAAMSRIIPTDHQPGAREANTTGFLDRYLSGIEYVYAKPDGSGFEKLSGKRAEAWRQRIEGLRKVYTEGIAEMDRRSRELFGDDFRALTEGQQDEVLGAMESRSGMDEGEQEEHQVAAGYGAPEEEAEPAMQQTLNESDLLFFPLLVLHTRQGFYGDPVYGGNRDRVGWEVLGFPGPESMAEVHSGRYSTLPYFAESTDHGEEAADGR